MSHPEVLTPVTGLGESLPAVQPGPTLDGSPLDVTGISAPSTNSVGSPAVCIYGNVRFHIAFGENPTASENNKPVAAHTDMCFRCNPADKVAVIKQAGQPNGKVWINPAVLND